MFIHETISKKGYEPDNILSQQTGSLIEQKIVTLYRDESGFIFQHTTTRHFTKDDYYDSQSSKYIG